MSTPTVFALWNRASVVTVGTVQISNIGQQEGLGAWFEVKRSLKPNTPNTCDLRLYNLSDAHRQTIEQYTQTPTSSKAKKASSGIAVAASVVPVTIVAGYVGNMGLVFSGALRTGQPVIDGADTVMELNSGDGDQAAVLARTSYAFPPGANAYGVVQQLLADMNAGAGNTSTVANVLKGSPLYSMGVTLKGSSFDHLQDIARSCGLEVSIQKGAAQWAQMGKATSALQYHLTPSTGLYGSPTMDTKGLVSVQTALIPGINPGDPVKVDAKFVSGQLRVTDIETTGSTFGPEWGHKINLKREGLAP